MEREDYKTRQRDAVLALFASQPQRSMTANEAYLELLYTNQPVGRTTVYRTVTLLSRQGRLISIKDGPAPIRYQHREYKQKHISVRCNVCGMIADLTCEAVNHFEEHLRDDHGFILQEDKCLLPGLCKACQQ